MRALPPVSRPAPARAGPSAAPRAAQRPCAPFRGVQPPAGPEIGSHAFSGAPAATAAQACTGMGMCIFVKYSWEQRRGPECLSATGQAPRRIRRQGDGSFRVPHMGTAARVLRA